MCREQGTKVQRLATAVRAMVATTAEASAMAAEYAAVRAEATVAVASSTTTTTTTIAVPSRHYVDREGSHVHD
jgi:hypothetical protein